MKGRRHRSAPVAEDIATKINPRVLRQLLFEIVEEEFGGDRASAARKLRLANPIKGKYYPYTKDIISNIIEDRSALKYAHLEAIANYYRMPTFMLLLFSRLRSEDEKSPGMELRDISEVRRLVSFLSEIESTIEDCAFRAWDLKRWGAKYNRLNLALDSLPVDGGCDSGDG